MQWKHGAAIRAKIGANHLFSLGMDLVRSRCLVSMHYFDEFLMMGQKESH